MYLPAIVSVNSWFEARRAIAVSIAVSGSGVGTFIFNPLATFLLKRYSLTGCMLVMAAIAILGTFFALLLRPPPTRLRVQTHQAELATIPVRNEKRMKILIRFFIWIKDAVDWRLLTDWRFFLYAASSFFGGFCSYVPYMYLSSRAVEESDLDKQDASWLMSIVGIANILGRLTSGVLSDRKIADNSALYIIACIVGGVATSVSVFCNTYLQYAVYAAFFGYTGGLLTYFSAENGEIHFFLQF
jgi:predicted MFS family arabinose efflux permease